MKTIKVINVVGARPNFMKIAPIIEAMARVSRINHLLVHTGQHYDGRMSQVFFEDLGLPRPDINLGVGSGSHAEQTARIMVEFEKICLQQKPDLVLVVGDVNSTLACTLTAKKLGIRVAHVEAGLRSRDMQMPEEINRLCTDVLCDFLFTTDVFANRNLLAEGITEDKIYFVGNVMIDTLLKHREKASSLNFLPDWGLEPQEFATLTLHRPSNVDERSTFEGILEALREISRNMPVIFPAHPRTRKMASDFGLDHFFSQEKPARGVWIIEPMGYLQFLYLNMNAKMVLTDSGGLQEETTALGIPCITLRCNTERPITCEMGTNILAGNRKEDIVAAVQTVISRRDQRKCFPEKWDGLAAERIVKIIEKEMDKKSQTF